MKPRLKALLFVAALFVVGYAAMWVLHSMPIATQQQQQYKSMEERQLPCGRILRRTVEERDGAWIKTVTLLSPQGEVLETKTQTVEADACAKIKAGVFVPNLWSDCQMEGLRQNP